jgi:hypothetical protein
MRSVLAATSRLRAVTFSIKCLSASESGANASSFRVKMFIVYPPIVRAAFGLLYANGQEKLFNALTLRLR